MEALTTDPAMQHKKPELKVVRNNYRPSSSDAYRMLAERTARVNFRAPNEVLAAKVRELQNSAAYANLAPEAEAIDLMNANGAIPFLPDDRLERLATSFLFYHMMCRYNITFTAFVKMVESGRWEWFINPDNIPASTIERRHKLKFHWVNPSMQRTVRLNRLWAISFVGIIAVILTTVLWR